MIVSYSDNHCWFLTCEVRMRVAVIGSTGHTGAQVVIQALASNHQVIAVARHPNRSTGPDAGLVSMVGDVLDQHSMNRALADADAVVSALGIGASRNPTVVYSHGTANILRAMQAHSIRKLAVISAAPVGPRTEQPFVERRIIMPVLERIFGATYDDMRRMETELGRSELDWVALRPPRLLDKPATGSYRLDANRPLPKARSITYADLAAALLDCLDRKDLYQRAVSVAN